MTKTFAALTTALLTACFISTAVQAAPAKPAACPFCKMPLSMKATKDTPVAITMHGKKYYTCTPCKAKVAAMKTMKPAAKAAPKAM